MPESEGGKDILISYFTIIISCISKYMLPVWEA